MFKLIFMALLFSHILGDYYFQPQKMADAKQGSSRATLCHGAIYAGVTFLAVLVVANRWLIVAAAIAAISHLAIDLIKMHYTRNYPNLREERVYVIDQTAHLAFLLLASIIAAAHCPCLHPASAVKAVFETMDLNPQTVFQQLFLLLLICKPANIMIKKILAIYKPADAGSMDGERRAGAFIGSLERLIMLIFLSLNQYAAIGLVLTAKSIARYDKISTDKAFAEYYLLGTLLSTVFVLICGLLFLK